MTTFGDLKNEIASEIGRDDLDTQIGYAGLDALRSLNNSKTTFNSGVDTSLFTTAGSQLMALPANTFAIKSITLDYGSYHVLLKPWSYADIVHASLDDGFTGKPIAFAVFNGQIYFDIPADAVYSATVSFWKEFALPVSPTDNDATNAWITGAYTVVKFQTYAFLYMNALFDPEKSAGYQAMADRQLANAQGQLAMQTDSNSLSLRP